MSVLTNFIKIFFFICLNPVDKNGLTRKQRNAPWSRKRNNEVGRLGLLRLLNGPLSFYR